MLELILMELGSRVLTESPYDIPRFMSGLCRSGFRPSRRVRRVIGAGGCDGVGFVGGESGSRFRGVVGGDVD